MTSARIEVLDSASKLPIKDAYCLVRGENPDDAYSAVTNDVGRGSLIGLVPLANTPNPEPENPDENGEHPINVTVELAALGYLPLKRVFALTANKATMQLQLVPESTGFESPMIKAFDGCKLELTGLGHLEIPPGVLSQDAVIRITPIPSWSNASGLFEDHVAYQFYAAAYDDLGQPLPGVIPSSYSGITLTVNLDSELPTDAQDEKWTAHALGTSFQQGLTSSLPGNLKPQQLIAIPVCEGHNALTHTYAVYDAECATTWTPWYVVKTLRDTTKEVIAHAPFKCGHYMFDVTVGRGVTVENSRSVTLSETQSLEIGASSESILKTITDTFSLKYDVTSTSTTTTGTVTTQSFEAEIGVHAQAPVSGISPQPSGWDCISGRVEWGYLTSRYQIWAFRRKQCVVNGRVYEKVNLGSVEVAGSFDHWFNGVHWDPTCPGCDPSGNIPPDITQY